MQCKICGSNLVRGFTFCLDCGNPVPPELLEESGLPQRNIDRVPQEIQEDPKSAKPADVPQPEEPVGDLKPRLIGGEQERGKELKPELKGGNEYEQGKALKPKLIGFGEEEAGEALKPRLIGGEEQAGGGEKVRAALQNSSADVSDTAVEKLVFCPNCGMHMQHNPNKCEICGMALENKQPNYVPKTESGIPLFNTDPDPFSGTGGFGGIGSIGGGFGGFGGIPDEDVARIDNFANGNTDPMFNSGSSAFNVNATPADFAHLTEQIASFSSAAVPDIGVTESTRVRQKAAPKGKDVELDDFSMIDDLQSESVPIVDSHVPVVGDYSMEENPDEDVDIDPFAFVSMSMDEAPQESYMETVELPEEVPVNEPTKIVPVIDNSRYDPVQPPSFSGRAPEETAFDDTAPFIAEESPVINEATPTTPANTAAMAQQPVQQAQQPIQQAQQPLQQAQQPIQEAQPSIQQAQPPVQQAQPPVQQAQPNATPARPAEKTKKCYACGRSMPVKDKFCPNCGRSMFGAPNPNLISHAPTPTPTKKKPPIALIIVLIIAVAVVAVVFFVTKANAAEIDFERLYNAVTYTEQTFSENVAEYFIS